MLFKSSILAQASGSLSGTTFSHNRFGQYTRNRSIPVNPNTSRQQTIRSILTFASAAWSALLTQAQRDQWDVYAAAVPVINKLGDTVYLTGFNWWVASAVARYQAGLTPVAAGPATLVLPDTDPTLSFTASEATQALTITFDDTLTWCDEDNAGLTIFVGQPLSGTRVFFNGPFRYADKIPGSSLTPPTSTTTIDSPFVFQEGQKLFIQCRILRGDGRNSSFFKASAVAAA